MKLFKLLLLLVLAAAPAYGETSSAPDADVPTATISGRLLTPDKKPLTTVVVLLYDKSLGPPPSPDKYWRIPDLITGTDSKGNFSIEVSAGTYYLQASQKQADGVIGPPKAKELFYYHGSRMGKPLPLVVTPGSKLNLGNLVSYLLYSPDTNRKKKGITSVEGIVTDLEGKPVQGSLVFASLSGRVQERATFVSDRTDKNGKFQLKVAEGTYYLRVRSIIGGGAPEEGEYLNITSEFTPIQVTLVKGQHIKGITLKVKQFSRRGSAQRPAGTNNSEKTWKNLGDLQAQ